MAPRSPRVLIASDWAPIRLFDPIVRRDPGEVYGDLLPVIRDADLRIVNCECALTRSEKSVWKSGAVFKGVPAHVRGLTTVPFDVACLGNNHTLDYGVAGLRETLNVLHRNGIRTVGAGLTEREAYKPLQLKVAGVDLRIINFSEGEDLTDARGRPGVFGWDIGRVQDEVRRAKGQGAIALAIGHCGLEYVPYPPPYVVRAFRAIADAGADCVIGHHPHVPQGIEWYRGTPIVYSLGNFVFYQPVNLHYRKTGFCVSLQLERDAVADLSLHPYRITDTGLRSLDDREEGEFLQTLSRISRPFRTPDGPARAWDAYLDYYGPTGFSAEVTGILDRMKTELPKGAAMFRNRVTTMQHAELWRDALTRMMQERPKRPPREAANVVAEWFTRPAS